MIKEYIVQITDSVRPDAFARFEDYYAPEQELVRCKDCKHYKDGFCYNPNTYDDEKTRGNTVPNWFCGDGERE